MRRGTAESETTDSSGNLKTGNNPNLSNQNQRGTVTMADGAAPQELVEIDADCPSLHRAIAVTDSKGKFGSGLNLVEGCTVHASLEGYRSDVVNVVGRNLGNIVLSPISSDPAGLTSSSDAQATDNQRKTFQKALDKAARADWKGAIASLREVVSANPNYASALLTLGICLQNAGDLANAEKAYLDSARADPTFALPLVRAAALESIAGNMQAALTQSEKAIKLNPKAFPGAYSLNAIAGISTQHADQAEASARAGLALDTKHQYPQLEFALGMVLSTKDDMAAAKEHLQRYINQSPNGPNAETARNQLAQMDKSQAAANLTATTTASQAGPSVTVNAANSLPTTDSFREKNAPLLAHPDAYTCLESILPIKADPRGKPAILDTIRLDIAISSGKEIYSAADGKRFSAATQRDMLGYSFATTGLFASIARALISANQFAIEPAGESQLQGETVLRYNFRALPSTAGWSIAYGKESATVPEQGWFLINAKTQLLRRAFVSAANIPASLKLVELSARIDYEPETIVGRRVLLPSVARMQVVERSGLKHMSLLSFDHCRAFAADSTVSFDDLNGESQQLGKSLNIAHLPPNLELLLALTSALSSTSAADNDTIYATIVKPVVVGGRELIKAGAPVEGHVRLKQGGSALMLQFDRVQTSSGWAPFYAQLTKLGTTAARVEGQAPQDQLVHTLLVSDNSTDLTEPDIPGIATIIFNAGETELSSGTQMIWKTQPLLVEHKDALTPQLNTSMSMH